jgi:hypothetical protein
LSRKYRFLICPLPCTHPTISIPHQSGCLLHHPKSLPNFKLNFPTLGNDMSQGFMLQRVLLFCY